MTKLRRIWCLASIALTVAGCNFTKNSTFVDDSHHYDFHALATQVEYPDAHACYHSEGLESFAPRSLDDAAPEEFWDLSLDEAVAIALQNSEVMRDLGGRVLTGADGAQSIYDPALLETDPLFGVEAALSAFDAQFDSSLFLAKNDRAVNNITLGGGTREIVQDLASFEAELSKTAATGTRFSLRNLTQYDRSNQPGNQFPSGWDTQFEAEARQPLLQGAGVTFNRIAGPNAQPGFRFSNGVMIARINTDISIADFEAGVRDFVSQVEEAYWDLYFAYRTLDASTLARDSALQTWQAIKAQQGLPGGTAEPEARARAQYFAFQDQVQDALNGNPRSGRTVGVYRGERRLRLMMGLPSNDGRVIRPADAPMESQIVFSWYEALGEALARRVELRRQKWKIQRSEMQLLAAKNFRLPRLDAVALYRLRGFGDQLTGDGPPQTSAFQDLGTADHQEWQVGLELNVPIGFRRAWSGIRQAELQLARDRAVFREQELQVSHGLADAISETSRSHAAIRTNYNRLLAAQDRLKAAQEVLQVDKVSVDAVLESQQEVADAQARYYESLANHAIAIKNVNLQKGSLLASHNVFLSEGLWPNKAYGDALELTNRLRPKLIDYRFNYPGVVSQGAYDQEPWIEQGIGEPLNDSRETLPSPVIPGPESAAMDNSMLGGAAPASLVSLPPVDRVLEPMIERMDALALPVAASDSSFFEHDGQRATVARSQY